jgi:hypothetical protein
LERQFKIRILGADGPGLSAIEPVSYHNRFVNKIFDILEDSEMK